MKITKLLPIIVIAAALLLNACSGTGLSLAAKPPSAVSNSQNSGASAPLAGEPAIGRRCYCPAKRL